MGRPWETEASPYEDAEYTIKAHVGPVEEFDNMGEHQFEVCVDEGMRPEHSMLDVGCGCLRGGRFFIPYLDEGKYYGIEPEENILKWGIWKFLNGVKEEKKPRFSGIRDFHFHRLDETFDVILMQSLLTHCALRLLRGILMHAKTVLAPEGFILATLYLGKRTYQGPKAWVYPECVMHNEKVIRGAAEKEGLSMTLLPYDGHWNGQRWLRLEHLNDID